MRELDSFGDEEDDYDEARMAERVKLEEDAPLRIESSGEKSYGSL